MSIDNQLLFFCYLEEGEYPAGVFTAFARC